MFSSSRPAVAALALLLCATLTGCNGTDDPAPQVSDSTSADAPRPTGSTSSTPPESNPTVDPTTEPTTPSVAPSTGEELTIPGISSIRGPRSWISRQAVSSAAAAWVNLEDQSNISAVSTLENASVRPTSDTLAEQTLELDSRFKRRLSDLEIDGETAYRVEGGDAGNYVTEVGFVHDDRSLTIEFEFKPGTQDREGIIASVLASVELA